VKVKKKKQREYVKEFLGLDIGSDCRKKSIMLQIHYLNCGVEEYMANKE
jgi:hypothetical protein